MIRRQLITALGVVVLMTVMLGLVYPFAVTGVSQVAFHSKANDSLVKVNGKLVDTSHRIESDAELSIVHHEQHMNEVDYNIWTEYRS